MGKYALTRMIAENADLHTEPIPGESIVEIYGTNRVLVENHRGISQCTRDEITVRMKKGDIMIFGSCLKIALMSRERVVVCGNISGVLLKKEVTE